jgi:hypothetical protein
MVGKIFRFKKPAKSNSTTAREGYGAFRLDDALLLKLRAKVTRPLRKIGKIEFGKILSFYRNATHFQKYF